MADIRFVPIELNLALIHIHSPECTLLVGTAKTFGVSLDSRHMRSRTDWRIVSDFFRNRSCKMERRVLAANPSVRDRVNYVNARFRNQTGQRRLMVDPRARS